MLRKVIVLILLAVLVGYAAYEQFWKEEKMSDQEAAVANMGLEIGKEAPDFELQTLDGTSVKMSNYKGKKVIVNFWATWCPPCKKEVPELQAFYEKHGKDVVILAVNLTISERDGGQEKVKRFAEEYGITFPILMDTKSEVSGLYKAIALPTSYFVDTKGVIRQKFIGPMTLDYMENTVKELP